MSQLSQDDRRKGWTGMEKDCIPNVGMELATSTIDSTLADGTIQSVSIHIPSGCWPTGVWADLTRFCKFEVACGLRST